MRLHVAYGQIDSRLQSYNCSHGLSQDSVGDTDDSGFGDVRMLMQDVFNFARADLLSAALDDVVFTADPVQKTFFVGSEQISRVEPHLVWDFPRLQSLRGQLRS